jgi:very-short-patch-repair endonuclease
MSSPFSQRIDALVSRVRALDGVAPSARMQREGTSPDTIAAAVRTGALLRVRRRSVALPDADPLLVAAARAGVSLTCCTAAARHGLWVLDQHVFHVAAPAHAGRIVVASGTRVHRARPLLPRHPESLVDGVVNVLGVVSACLPAEQALAVWDSALNKRLVTLDEMRRYPLSARARDLAEEATPLPDSGLETFLIVRLRWLRERLTPQAWILGHRVDLLIGEKLVLHVDGGHHVGAQREADIRHDTLLTLNGYHVIRVGYRQMVEDWPSVQLLIVQAIAQGLHRAR